MLRRVGDGWTDERMLTALHLFDNEGLAASVICRRLGVSRSSVLGMMHRVRADDAKVADRCTDPANRDRGMGPLWWQLPEAAE